MPWAIRGFPVHVMKFASTDLRPRRSICSKTMEKPRRRAADEHSSDSTAELRVPAREKDEGADSDYGSESENGEQRPDKP